MPDILVILIGTTFFQFKAEKNGKIYSCGRSMNVGPFVQNNLQEWDYNPRYNKYMVTNRYSSYDEELGVAKIPRYCLESFRQYIGDFPVRYEEIPPVHPTHVKMSMKKSFCFRPNQENMAEFMISPGSFKPLNVATGYGKCLKFDTLVKIPNGWKRICDLREGDIIISGTGYPTVVKQVYFPRDAKPMWKICFEDGRSSLCDDDQLWKIIYKKNDKEYSKNITTKELFLTTKDTGISNMDIGVPIVGKTFEPDKDFDLHPYIMGALLGNGYFTSNRVTLLDDKNIIDKIISLLPVNVHCELSESSGGDIKISFLDKNNLVVKTIKKYNLLNVEKGWYVFPEEYLDGSYNQRLSFIQGYLDVHAHFQDKVLPENIAEMKINDRPILYIVPSDVVLGMQKMFWSIGCKCSVVRHRFRPTTGNRKEDKNGYFIIDITCRHPQELVSLESKKEKFSYINSNDDCSKLLIKDIVPTIEHALCCCITVDDISQTYIIQDYVVTHNTSVSIYSAVTLQNVTLIILPMLISQWYREIKKFTNISKDDIYIVQGFKRLADLWKMKEGGFVPKIIIFSTRTLHMYAVNPEPPYSELPSYYEFQQQFGIGTKILDETHLNFCTNTQIDLYSNIAKNIYLSATYMRSEPQGARIFNMIFPLELRYGSQFKEKYCNVFVMQYHLGIPQDVQNKFQRQKGYNHALYENFVRKVKIYKDSFIDDVLIPIMKQYYFSTKKKGQKLLLLVATIDFTLFLYEKLLPVCHEYGCICSPYLSGDSRYGKDIILDNADVIISTHKSCGTGRDIKKLKICINTISFRSPVLANQMMGRLRKLPDDEVVFIDLWNGDIQAHSHHKYNRLQVYRSIAKKVIELLYN